jgi:hypothetical protein
LCAGVTAPAQNISRTTPQLKSFDTSAVDGKPKTQYHTLGEGLSIDIAYQFHEIVSFSFIYIITGI